MKPEEKPLGLKRKTIDQNINDYKIKSLEDQLRSLRRDYECRIVDAKQHVTNLNKLQDELQKIKFEASEANAKVKTLINAIAIMSEAKRTERSPNNMCCYPPWEWPEGYVVRR